ncbi:tRNA preQ1(34) S-adenosylmethionine ribosyltransferase-isomerase QueA [bacterium]|nr:tRNA preQ1(34) S-adenosylmethionine ribosyltransferase-isomerase QueA [bacterium]
MYSLKDYSYFYPPHLVAQHPLESRDASRMLVVNKQQKNFTDSFFKDLPNFLNEGDLLVFNNSKVFPCRLIGKKETGGNVEIFLINEIKSLTWTCLVHASKRLAEGTKIIFDHNFTGTLLEDNGRVRTILFDTQKPVMEWLSHIGHIPLPPYIKRADDKKTDTERYQTIYAQKTGSLAAPTAGFHFNEAMMETLKTKKIETAFITLHVGLGTFLPIKSDDIRDHAMHGESYEISEETVAQIRNTKKDNKKVVVVGTTAMRALESAASDKVQIKAGPGYTEKFIYPPYEFKVADALFTNFHQPESTLLVLVSAFAGRDFILSAYQHAVTKEYRLFSYGDCMLII